MAAFQYLDPETIVETYYSAKQYTESLTNPWFIEYERIARNQVRPDIAKQYPKTTDGTTASIVRKTPHRIIQQLPSGTVVSDKDDWLSIVASFIYRKKIIPYANSQYDLLQKCWSTVEKALTFGSQFTYVPFLNHDGYFCPDLTLPYWGDIMVQPGKLSDEDCNYLFMRSWWNPEDIKALIDKETKQSKSKSYTSTWDVSALKEVLSSTTTKDTVAQTPVEREKAVNQKGKIELVTGFQKGVGANFYTFHPSTRGVVRTKENKDPRGVMPVIAMYADIDGSNPLGRGIVELVGGLQNLMDVEMQMYQYNRALMLNPPIVKYGSFNKNRIKFEPNTIIDAGSEANAKVETLAIDSTAIANFPNNYGLMKSQLLNLLASPDTSISSQVGNPGFSKTPAGVAANQANLSVDDNYMRKQFEAWFEKWSETAINLYFAERTGIEELQLNDETVEELMQSENFDQSLISPDNKIRINYDTATPALQFRVNASSSQKKDDLQQQEIAISLLDMVMKYPQLNSNWGGAIDVDELARKIVVASAIEDPELVAPEPTKEEKAQKQQSKSKPNGFSPLFDKPTIRIDYGDVEDPQARAQILALAGAQPGAPLSPMSPRLAETAARGVGQVLPQEEPQQPQPDPNAVGPDHILKAQAQVHQQQMDEARLALEAHKHNNPVQTTATGVTKAPKPFEMPQIDASADQQEQPQQGITQEDQQLVQALQQAGASEQQIGQAVAMLHHGYKVRDILKMLGIQ